MLWIVQAEDFPKAKEILRIPTNRDSIGAQTLRMDGSQVAAVTVPAEKVRPFETGGEPY